MTHEELIEVVRSMFEDLIDEAYQKAYPDISDICTPTHE